MNNIGRLPSNVLALFCVLLSAAALAKTGDPLPDVDVSLGRKPGGLVKQVKTDAQGNYTFGVLPPGEYTITIHWSSATAKSFFESRSNMREAVPAAGGAGAQANRNVGAAVQLPKTTRPLRVELSVTGGAAPVVRPAQLDLQDGETFVITVPAMKAISGKIVSME